jgi:hypothetical protein
MKYLRVTMPDGSKWDVEAMLISENRADYYSQKEEMTAAEYQEEIEFAMKNAYELHDWAANNMNWEDVKEFAKLVTDRPDIDYQEGWVNGEYEVVDVR